MPLDTIYLTRHGVSYTRPGVLLNDLSVQKFGLTA